MHHPHQRRDIARISMMSAGSIRGRHPFPAAGEGVVLHFRFTDLEALHIKYKDNWINDITLGIGRFDLAMLSTVIALGAKKDDKPFAVDLNTVEASLDDVALAVLDGFYLGVFGLTLQAHADKMEEMRKKAESRSGGADPLTIPSPPETS
jgi:hypothetical protein